MYSPELPLRPGSIYTNVGQHTADSPSSASQQHEVPSVRTSGILPVSNNYSSDTAKSNVSSEEQPQGKMHSVATTGIHLLVAFLCISTSLDAYNATLFCWHPIMMSLGFLGLMAEGILMAVNLRSVEGGHRVIAIQLHASVQALGIASIAIGFWAIWRNKVRHSHRARI